MLMLTDSPIGRLGIVESDDAITHLYLNATSTPPHLQPGNSALLREAANQLAHYFAGTLRVFTLPLRPAGTPFMLRVWQALCTVPYGTTASYKDVAVAVDSPRAARAVGMANNKNPIAIIIPCHRIIGANGALVGYAGGLAVKQALLNLESGVMHVV